MQLHKKTATGFKFQANLQPKVSTTLTLNLDLNHSALIPTVALTPVTLTPNVTLSRSSDTLNSRVYNIAQALR